MLFFFHFRHTLFTYLAKTYVGRNPLNSAHCLGWKCNRNGPTELLLSSPFSTLPYLQGCLAANWRVQWKMKIQRKIRGEEQWRGRNARREGHPIANDFTPLHLHKWLFLRHLQASVYFSHSATHLISRPVFWICLNAYLWCTFKPEERGWGGGWEREWGGHESKIKDKMVWFALQVYYFMAFTYSLPLQFQDFLLPNSYQYLGLYKYV